MKLSEAINEYLKHISIGKSDRSLQGYGITLKYMCLCLKNPNIQEITIEMIADYIYRAVELDFWSPNYFLQWRHNIKKFIQWMNLKKYTDLPIELIPEVHKEYKMPFVAPKEAIDTLINQVHKEPNMFIRVRDLAIIHILIDTGIRRSELISMKLDQIELEKQKATIRNSKSKSKPYGVVFWTDNTQDIFLEYLKLRMEFIEINDVDVWLGFGNGKFGQKLKDRALNKILEKYSCLAQLPYVLNPHSFRHYKGRDMRRKGASLPDIMNVLRHTDMKSTMIYTWETDNEAQKIFQKYE